MCSDETSKLGNKLCGYHVHDIEGTILHLDIDTLLQSQQVKPPKYLQKFYNIDIAADNVSSASRKMLTNITSTMLDSASTEVKLNELSEEHRLAELPYTIEKYTQLDEEEK